ncbi:hypothetical protein [Streptomyces sp. cg35]|uniref:hypothetical protein n=1 Tax=Streptomyces sp. cg35 TaxID=3421650 RepID=UPI003D1686AB
MDFKPGGFGLPKEPVELRDIIKPHPWKGEIFVPLEATPEQRAEAVAIEAFRMEIDLLDTSALDEL